MKHKALKFWPLLLALLLVAVTALAEISFPNALTTIGEEAFYNDKSLTGTLDLPDNVKVIGARAFEGCTGLTGKLIIPHGVTHINSRAFAYCTGFEGIVYIPASVVYLADDAFLGTNLQILDGSSSGGSGGSGGTDIPTPDQPDEVVTMTDLPEGIAFEMTADGAVITGYTGDPEAKLTIPSAINGVSVVAIGDYAFQDCYGLTGSLVIPGTVKRIGASAFFCCSGLDGTVTIPSSVTEIGDFAFFECLSLTGSLTLPASVETVGESAFAYCESMTGSLSLPADVTLGARCFQGSGFTGSLSIPATMTLGPNVFVGTKLNLSWARPSFTYEMADGAVTITGWNGPMDSGLVIPETIGGAPVVSIAPEAFTDIGLRGPVTIPGSVVRIGSSAFRGNSGITSLTLSEGLTTIEDYAFANCTGLSGTITLPSTVTLLADTAFSGVNAVIQTTPAP